MKTKLKSMTSVVSPTNSWTSPRSIRHATPESLLEFCNEVRAAGNAGLLGALLPSKPQNATECLIARALNFESTVMPVSCTRGGTDVWGMFPKMPAVKRGNMKYSTWLRKVRAASDAHDQKVRDLAKVLGMRTIREDSEDRESRLGLMLPVLIGNCAEAFDNDAEAFSEYRR